MTRSLRDKAQTKLELYNGQSLLTFVENEADDQHLSLSSASSQIWLVVYPDTEPCRMSTSFVSYY
jgi:hypothetical protein